MKACNQRNCLLVLAAWSTMGLAVLAEPGEKAPQSVPVELFTVPEGLEITVWATSPLLHNPTNMDVDRYGRVWVAEGMNYRRLKLREGGDQIVVLTDTDGDGKADKSHVFVQEKALQAPLGIAVIDNRIVVSQPPDLIVYTDVDRDAVFNPEVDKREVLLTGWGGRNHDHSLHSVTVSPSGQWVFNTGNAGGHRVTDRSGSRYLIGSHYAGKQWAGQTSSDGHVYVGGTAFRMNPDGTGLRVIGFNFRNSYEQTVTSFGDVFNNDNDDPPAARTTWLMEYGNLGWNSNDGKRNWRGDKRPGQTTQIAEWRQHDPGVIPAGDVYGGGAPTGIAYNEGDGLGEKFRGLLLSCEPARNVVFGYYPKAEGAGYLLERFNFVTTNAKEEFAGTDFKRGNTGVMKILFRPSDVTVGPDGAIYIADWFDKRVGGHGAHDKEGLGTIYRVAPKGFKSKVPDFDSSSSKGAITALRSPAVNTRNIGFMELKADAAKSIKPVSKLLKDSNPYIKARAAWLLPQLGSKGAKAVAKLLRDEDALTRIVAFRSLRHADSDVLKHAAVLAKDSSAAVRREVALAMRDRPLTESRDILMDIARGYDGADRSYLEAFGIGAVGHEDAMYQALRAELGKDPAQWTPVFAGLAWRLHPERAVYDMKKYIHSDASSEEQKVWMLTGLAFIRSPAAAAAMKVLSENGPEASRAMAKWWVSNRASNEWRGFQETDGAPTVIVDAMVPTSIAAATTLPALEDIVKLKGDAKAGVKAVAKCYMCHKIGSNGIEFGPNLSAYGRANGIDVIVKAIVDPSADLSHGFEGLVIKTKGGKTLEGFLMVDDEITVIQVFGGAQVALPKSEIVSMKKPERSLMIPAKDMGLSAQEVRNIAEFLRSPAAAQ